VETASQTHPPSIPEEVIAESKQGLDILARGSSYSPRLLGPLANGTLRLSFPLTATGSRRTFTGLPERLLLLM
jgi:hypothetical protein